MIATGRPVQILPTWLRNVLSRKDVWESTLITTRFVDFEIPAMLPNSTDPDDDFLLSCNAVKLASTLMPLSIMSGRMDGPSWITLSCGMAGPVRQPIDVEALSKYLSKHVQDIKVPISVKQFGYGQSNPTYQLTDAAGCKYVLRKKPPGRLLSKTAHQVEREYRIIHALEPTNVPVPRTYCLCENLEILGTAFYVMEFLDGRIFEDASFPGVTAQERSDMWHDAIRTLAKLHQVRPGSVGLDDFGKPSGFYNRQIKTFGTISASQAQTVDIESQDPVGQIPHFNEIVAFLRDPRTQPLDRATLIHGDYKIDNLVFHKSKPEVIGILDWEMSTIGHPLSDLSNLLSPYTFAVDPPTSAMSSRTNPAFSPFADTKGLPTHAQCAQWYRDVAGWDPSLELKWGDIFANFRNSVIMQGIAARFAQRQASSEKAKEIGDLMVPYGEFCWGLVERWRRKNEVKAKF